MTFFQLVGSPCALAHNLGRGSFVAIDNFSATAIQVASATKIEQLLEGVGADGALLHAGLGVPGDGRVQGGCVTCPSARARKAKSGSPLKSYAGTTGRDGDDGSSGPHEQALVSASQVSG
jgi:hypothetical protein